MKAQIGWWLMGLPTGVRHPWPWLLRYGPYRLGAVLANAQQQPTGAVGEGDGTSHRRGDEVMSNETANLAERLIELGVLHPGCKHCDQEIAYIRKHGKCSARPQHNALPTCGSGGRPHCTCDRCF